jgi:hypothetical protein
MLVELMFYYSMKTDHSHLNFDYYSLYFERLVVYSDPIGMNHRDSEVDKINSLEMPKYGKK